MAIITTKIMRLFNFVTGTRAVAEQVNTELDQILVQQGNTVDDLTAQESRVTGVETVAGTNLTTHAQGADHDPRYYTKVQLDVDLSQLAEVDTAHAQGADHDPRYYTKVQLDLDLGQITSDYTALGARVDAMLAFSVAGVLVAEIVDARVGEASLGAKIRSVDAQWADTIQYQSEDNIAQYKKDVTVSDINGNPTEVQYTRKSDNTMVIKRNASNPDLNGFYQTVVEQFYNIDGVTVYKTVNYTFTFLENGIIDTSDGGVIS